MTKIKRKFEGIWIPANLWLDEDVSIQEKLFIVEIKSLSNKHGHCYASNSYFAKFFKISQSRCSHILSSLSTKGLIEVELMYKKKQIIGRNVHLTERSNNYYIEGIAKSSNRGIATNSHRGIAKSSIVNNIKEKNNIVEDESSTNTVHKKINGHSSLKNVDTSKYLKLAKKLSNIIQRKKNIKHTPAQIKTWAEEFRKLHTVNKVEPSRQKTILKWYKTSIGGQYIPVVESGKSFREKFIKLEDAMNRKDFTDKPKNNFTHHGSFELTKKSTKM